MTDEELIEWFETIVMYKMLAGCELDDHLYNKTRDVGSWQVAIRADQACRLLDLVKRSKP